MTHQDNGGPAFPSLHEIGDIAYTQGVMTLRDWFAGQSLAGGYAKWGRFSAKEIATLSYNIADAMLSARNAK